MKATSWRGRELAEKHIYHSWLTFAEECTTTSILSTETREQSFQRTNWKSFLAWKISTRCFVRCMKPRENRNGELVLTNYSSDFYTHFILHLFNIVCTNKLYYLCSRNFDTGNFCCFLFICRCQQQKKTEHGSGARRWRTPFYVVVSARWQIKYNKNNEKGI